jgi:membrane-associated protein
VNTFLPLLISWLQLYGYPALALSIFIASVGVPLPISFVLLAAGAFAALGDFNIVVLLLIAVTAATAGDSVGYCIGRFGGSRFLSWLARPRRTYMLSPRLLLSITRSRSYFNQRGGWAIFLSRFLFSGLGGTINLIAGIELYPYPRFLLLDFCGELVGALIPVLLGYAFGASWEIVGDILASITTLLAALLIACYLAFRLVKMMRRVRMRLIHPNLEEKLSRVLENDFLEAAPILPPSSGLERIHEEDEFPMTGRDKFPTS